MVGSKEVTFSVTFTVVEPDAPPVAATSTVPFRVPVLLMLSLLMETFTVPGAVPVVGVATSQLPVLVAVAVKAALPETVSCWDAGAASPRR